MNYEKAYKEALERARKLYKDAITLQLEQDIKDYEQIFPELKESEDEKIRKGLIKGLSAMRDIHHHQTFSDDAININEALAWLEKQGKPQDKGEISDGYHTFNELYYYRMLYNAAFFNMLPKEWVHKSKRHNDGEECFGGGWFIVMANLPTGQISNHYELKDWDLFQIPEKEVADKWDGHTPQEAADRLHKYLLEKQSEQKTAVTDFNAKDWYVSKVDGKIHDMTYNPADKVEPKFKVGDWLASNICNSSDLLHIIDVDNKNYEIETPQGNTGVPSIAYIDNNFHLWTIQDAKDGDVLASDNSIFIFQEEYIAEKPVAYCGLMNGLFIKGEDACWTNEKCHPATKEQRDLLFKRVNAAGYEWDAEKKELKKIHVIDDGKAEMDYCFTKMMAGEKVSPAWSEEDKNFMYDTLSNLTELKDRYGEVYGNVGKCIDWLKSLKDRVQPQPKQEWSEKDEEMCQETIDWFEKKCFPYALEEENPARESIKWLKSLKNRLPLVKNC